mmetsp:Transcript_65425/g.182045  ORF Transcript_65425/g.182045 Transcript_65425/m.182045 type:complete len:222 (-) Transcript_65425:1740-2405(-)
MAARRQGPRGDGQGRADQSAVRGGCADSARGSRPVAMRRALAGAASRREPHPAGGWNWYWTSAAICRRHKPIGACLRRLQRLLGRRRDVRAAGGALQVPFLPSGERALPHGQAGVGIQILDRLGRRAHLGAGEVAPRRRGHGGPRPARAAGKRVADGGPSHELRGSAGERGAALRESTHAAALGAGLEGHLAAHDPALCALPRQYCSSGWCWRGRRGIRRF